MQRLEVLLQSTSAEIGLLSRQLEEWDVEGICIEDERDFQEFLERHRECWDYVDEGLTQHYQGLSQIRFYLPDDAAGNQKLQQIQTAFARPLTIHSLSDTDWADGWKRQFQSIEIGAKLRILPDWMDAPADGRVNLRLEPGNAFGTGSHATTKMCLEALDKMELDGKRALDLGCGSGILAIAALLLGCSMTAGCDHNPDAQSAARENAMRNGIAPERLKLCTGDILHEERLQASLGGGYDVVLANIVADVIIPLSTFARRFLAPEGRFVVSGVIDDRVADVMNALTRNGFQVLRHIQQEEWHCFVCTDIVTG
ncbi:MAG: 50S ribosomal protein L11 methyltransferase [Oscillospiraceae bacterium]|nr:50S ribosomal protein L11 methyltransferase [Oscillospiraceae bacterium]